MPETTKRGISAALKRLSRDKSLDKISVNSIAKDCGVNRMTIYHNFENIYDIVKWTCKDDSGKIKKQSKECDTWKDGCLLVCGKLAEDKAFVSNVFNSACRKFAEELLYVGTYDFLLERSHKRLCGKGLKEADEKFVIEFYKCVFAGFVVRWIDEGMQEDYRVQIEKLEALITGDIPLIIKIMKNDKS